MLQVLVNGGYRYTDIPVNVGKWQRLAILFDGTTWTFLSTGRSKLTYTGGNSNVSGAGRNYIGSGYNAQLPCAFRQFISGDAFPGVAAAESWLADPWSVVEPA
jgi:hypothetical protein